MGNERCHAAAALHLSERPFRNSFRCDLTIAGFSQFQPSFSAKPRWATRSFDAVEQQHDSALSDGKEEPHKRLRDAAPTGPLESENCQASVGTSLLRQRALNLRINDEWMGGKDTYNASTISRITLSGQIHFLWMVQGRSLSQRDVLMGSNSITLDTSRNRPN